MDELSSPVREIPVNQLSFTDAFLRAVQLMATTAGDPPPAEEAHPDVPVGAEGGDEAMDVDFDNLDIFHDFPGNQLWWLFRPDPFLTGRRDCLQLRVTATTSMREIENQIVQVWPDLRPGSPNWTILYANNLAFDSLHPPMHQDGSAFVVKAIVDEPPGPAQHSVVLLSMRTWNSRTGHVGSSSMHAFVLDTQSEIHEIFDSIDFHQRCDSSPCPIEHNGDIIFPWDHHHPLRVFDGDFLNIHAVTHLDEVFAMTADQTGQGVPAIAELPGYFQQRVVRQMQGQYEADELIMITCTAQQALTSWARSIFRFTHMISLEKPLLAAFVPESDSVVFMRFTAPQPLDVYQLYYSIVTYMLDGDEQNWQFVPIFHADSAFLDPQAQYVGIRQEDRHVLYDPEVLCLIEIRLASENPGTSRYQEVEYHSRFLPSDLDIPTLYQTANVDALCAQEDCLCWVNGQVALPHGSVHLPDGSFIQIFIGDDTSSNTSNKGRSDCLMIDNMETETVADATRSSARSLQPPNMSEASTTTRPSRPLLGGLIMVLIRPRFRMILLLCGICLFLNVERFGEALHPGPMMWLGTTNPSGLRGKEETYFSLPEGLWGIAETHLTQLNQRDAHASLKRLANTHQRALQFYHGAPVAPRSARSTTGTWSGVSFAADMPCLPIQIPWPNSEFSLGRIQMAQVWYGPFQMTGANLYGWPQSPTWPRALEATEQHAHTPHTRIGALPNWTTLHYGGLQL